MSKNEERKNARTVMGLLDVLCLLLLAAGLFFGIRFLMNELFLKNYRAQDYSTKYESGLTKANINEDYLPYYNMGNAYYQNGDYDKAITNYKLALVKNPPKYKECPVRINLALAMIQKINFDNLNTQNKIENAIRQLKAARAVLVEDGCANPAEDVFDGHSAEAEQLKKDIDEMIKKLQEQQQQQQQNQDEEQQEPQPSDGNDDEEQQQPQDSEREDELRDKLNDQKQEANKERSEMNGDRENRNGGGGYDFDGKTW